MNVKELIEILKEFPEDMEVVYDYDSKCSTCTIYEVYIGNEFHDKDNKKVVVLE